MIITMVARPMIVASAPALSRKPPTCSARATGNEARPRVAASAPSPTTTTVASQIATPPPSGVGRLCPLWPAGTSSNPHRGAQRLARPQNATLSANASATRPRPAPARISALLNVMVVDELKAAAAFHGRPRRERPLRPLSYRDVCHPGQGAALNAETTWAQRSHNVG